MAVSFGYERRKFEAMQNRLRKKYEAAGMDECQINELFDLDQHQFNRDIAFYRHTQPLEMESDEDFDFDRSPLRRKYAEGFSVFQKPTMTAQFWWLDEIDTPVVVKCLKRLTHDELELLDCLAFRELTQREISILYGTTQASISRRFAAIRKKLGRQLQMVSTGRQKPIPLQKEGKK